MSKELRMTTVENIGLVGNLLGKSIAVASGYSLGFFNETVNTVNVATQKEDSMFNPLRKRTYKENYTKADEVGRADAVRVREGMSTTFASTDIPDEFNTKKEEK